MRNQSILECSRAMDDKPFSIPAPSPSPPAVAVAQFSPSPLLPRLVSRSVNLDDPAGSWLVVHTAFYCLSCPPHSIVFHVNIIARGNHTSWDVWTNTFFST